MQREVFTTCICSYTSRCGTELHFLLSCWWLYLNVSSSHKDIRHLVSCLTPRIMFCFFFLSQKHSIILLLIMVIWSRSSSSTCVQSQHSGLGRRSTSSRSACLRREREERGVTICVHIVAKIYFVKKSVQKATGKVKRYYYRAELSFTYFNGTENLVAVKVCVDESKLLTSLAGAFKHCLPSDRARSFFSASSCLQF